MLCSCLLANHDAEMLGEVMVHSGWWARGRFPLTVCVLSIHLRPSSGAMQHWRSSYRLNGGIAGASYMATRTRLRSVFVWRVGTS